jgi:hypothetical protein
MMRALSIAASLLCACTGHSLRWEVRADDPGLTNEIATVELEVRIGGCDDGLPTAYRSVRTRTTATGSNLPDDAFERGTYGFAALAVNAECRTIARGCTEVTLPIDENVVVTGLAREPPETLCPESRCSEGTCAPPTRDGGVPDTGAADAGPPERDACAAIAETCNSLDDDCDGRIDEGVTRACASDCEAGVETCSGGTFTGCTAREPEAESCDGVDNDCNGTVDDCALNGACFRGSCELPDPRCSRVGTYDGHLYMVCPDLQPRAGARGACIGWGGYLASFDSAAEEDFVVDLIGGTDAHWIGLMHVGGSMWAWDRSSTAYENFCPSEPSGNGPCAVIGLCAVGGGRGYDDQPCEWTNAYLCERE